MNIAWVHYDRIKASARINVARGYLNFSRFLRAAAGKGLSIIDVDEGEDAHPRLFLHLCPPHLFRPVPGKRNVLFTMWESEHLPPDVLGPLRAANDLLVPSRWCSEVWSAHGLRSEVVPLGVEGEFLGATTERPLGRLRFLALGSKLGRKGWQLLAPAWSEAFGAADDVELYVKVIGDGSVEPHFDGRVIVDQRDLSRAELVRLYESSHAFCCTSYGEGFGLIALEAMAAGCLVLAPAHTGLLEFVSPSTAIEIARSATARAFYGVEFSLPVPSSSDIAAALRRAADGWGTPDVEAIRHEGVRVARGFTWEASARRLRDVLWALTERAGLAA